jgi:EAL domain-containing protein (putative c-di-GMP-specific phosphodiesterase class I)
VYQPIVQLETGEPAGYEALTRFADGVPPDVRFAEAAAAGLGTDYELAAMRAATETADDLPGDAYLSLNVSPDVVVGSVRRLAEILRRSSRQIVLEVTEHARIADYAAFRRAVGHLDEATVAIDDAGAGYASLRHILELRPAFAKLDMSLVRGIDGDPLRQGLVAGLAYFAVRTGCRLIAEGVERQEEAGTLRGIGVEFAQGYLFGRPEQRAAVH